MAECRCCETTCRLDHLRAEHLDMSASAEALDAACASGLDVDAFVMWAAKIV